MGPIHLETQTKPVNRMPIASRNVARGCTHTVVERLDPDIGVSSVHRLARAQSNSAVYRKPRCSSVHRLSSRGAPKYSACTPCVRIAPLRNFAIRSYRLHYRYPFPPSCECQWLDTQDQVICEHLVRFVLDAIDISYVVTWTYRASFLGTKFLIEIIERSWSLRNWKRKF